MATIRRPGAASAAVLIALSASVAGAHLLTPEWSRRMGLDVWNLAAVEEERRLAVEERADMDAKAEFCARRRAVADRIAVRLIARDADLATVAVELFDLFGEDSGVRCTLEASNPKVRDPRLLFAGHAIQRVSRLLVHEPARWATVRAQLEADYRELEARWASAP